MLPDLRQRRRPVIGIAALIQSSAIARSRIPLRSAARTTSRRFTRPANDASRRSKPLGHFLPESAAESILGDEMSRRGSLGQTLTFSIRRLNRESASATRHQLGIRLPEPRPRPKRCPTKRRIRSRQNR